jgi:hypothetical protein
MLSVIYDRNWFIKSTPGRGWTRRPSSEGVGKNKRKWEGSWTNRPGGRIEWRDCDPARSDVHKRSCACRIFPPRVYLRAHVRSDLISKLAAVRISITAGTVLILRYVQHVVQHATHVGRHERLKVFNLERISSEKNTFVFFFWSSLTLKKRRLVLHWKGLSRLPERGWTQEEDFKSGHYKQNFNVRLKEGSILQYKAYLHNPTDGRRRSARHTKNRINPNFFGSRCTTRQKIHFISVGLCKYTFSSFYSLLAS